MDTSGSMTDRAMSFGPMSLAPMQTTVPSLSPSAYDRANGVAVGPAGPYVVGDTTGTFAGATNEGGVDAFLAAPRAPLPAPFEGPPAGARLLVGLVAAAAVPIASVAAICLVRWRIFRRRS